MLKLPNVTLIGADCVNFPRLQLAADISTTNIEFGDVKLLTSLKNDDPRSVEIPLLLNIVDYSVFCLRDLHSYVDTEFALVIQHDGFVLNAAAWDDVFLKYDYNGAPIYIGKWAQKRWGIPKEKIPFEVVGNGGFSLRSKKLMEATSKLLAERIIRLRHPEDWSISYEHRSDLEAVGMKIAPLEVARKFSFEGGTKKNHVYDGAFGFHSLKYTDISPWLNEHSEYQDRLINIVVDSWD